MAKKANPWPARLKKLREAKGWSREQLAERLGLAPRTLFYYELGNRYPSAPVAKLIEHIEAGRID